MSSSCAIRPALGAGRISIGAVENSSEGEVRIARNSEILRLFLIDYFFEGARITRRGLDSNAGKLSRGIPVPRQLQSGSQRQAFRASRKRKVESQIAAGE